MNVSKVTPGTLIKPGRFYGDIHFDDNTDVTGLFLVVVVVRFRTALLLSSTASCGKADNLLMRLATVMDPPRGFSDFFKPASRIVVLIVHSS